MVRNQYQLKMLKDVGKFLEKHYGNDFKLENIKFISTGKLETLYTVNDTKHLLTYNYITNQFTVKMVPSEVYITAEELINLGFKKSYDSGVMDDDKTYVWEKGNYCYQYNLNTRHGYLENTNMDDFESLDLQKFMDRFIR